MDAEDVITLFDSCWFSEEIFKKRSNNPCSSCPEGSPDHKIGDNSSKPTISQLSIHTRSKSDQLTSSNTSLNSDSLSPYSVLYTPHLQTVVSEKDLMLESPRTPQPRRKDKGAKKKTKRSLSKSLSELEFEELKGFMDLGFVFSEKDKDSSLVEIIPGLQRLGKAKYGEEQKSTDVDKSSIARPYLAEAWDVLSRRKRENALMNWRVPEVSNEIDMKDNLKWWAHTVATTIR